eukprot:TRINITY_DN70338_c0_g1_i1.p1 TRINITY_DN70338_c0_g1~~TRINITY_DN70338_c0_g1_i1.p1  ORF type:complete len:356 (-),score=68.76 TRINITY_DN70338_c0_g1_i1:97-1164(-)
MAYLTTLNPGDGTLVDQNEGPSEEIIFVATRLSSIPAWKARKHTVVIEQGTELTVISISGSAGKFSGSPLFRGKLVNTNSDGDALIGVYLAALTKGVEIGYRRKPDGCAGSIFKSNVCRWPDQPGLLISGGVLHWRQPEHWAILENTKTGRNASSRRVPLPKSTRLMSLQAAKAGATLRVNLAALFSVHLPHDFVLGSNASTSSSEQRNSAEHEGWQAKEVDLVDERLSMIPSSKARRFTVLADRGTEHMIIATSDDMLQQIGTPLSCDKQAATKPRKAQKDDGANYISMADTPMGGEERPQAKKVRFLTDYRQDLLQLPLTSGECCIDVGTNTGEIVGGGELDISRKRGSLLRS